MGYFVEQDSPEYKKRIMERYAPREDALEYTIPPEFTSAARKYIKEVRLTFQDLGKDDHQNDRSWLHIHLMTRGDRSDEYDKFKHDLEVLFRNTLNTGYYPHEFDNHFCYTPVTAPEKKSQNIFKKFFSNAPGNSINRQDDTSIPDEQYSIRSDHFHRAAIGNETLEDTATRLSAERLNEFAKIANIPVEELLGKMQPQELKVPAANRKEGYISANALRTAIQRVQEESLKKGPAPDGQYL